MVHLLYEKPPETIRTTPSPPIQGRRNAFTILQHDTVQEHHKQFSMCYVPGIPSAAARPSENSNALVKPTCMGNRPLEGTRAEGRRCIHVCSIFCRSLCEKITRVRTVWLAQRQTHIRILNYASIHNNNMNTHWDIQRQTLAAEYIYMRGGRASLLFARANLKLYTEQTDTPT